MAPEPLCTFWRGEESLLPTGIQTLDRPTHSLIAITTALLRLLQQNVFVTSLILLLDDDVITRMNLIFV